MALSVIDLCKDILPGTNCGDCGYPTCMAFAGMVVSEKLPVENCPH
jgi:Na+-translocating ferredoxin:NAD+ oxidoreductase RNF subunit RnfB